MGLLKEYMGDLDKSLTAVTEMLEEHFGEMYRVGGARVYDITNGQKGAVFVCKNLSGIGLGWHEPDKVKTIYYWNSLSLDAEPDYALDIPDNGDVTRMLPTIVNALKHQQLGQIEVS